MKKLFSLSILLIICCLYVDAQSMHYKELLFNGQYKELIQLIQNEVPDNEIAGDTARTLAQAYEGLLKHREAYTYFGRWLSVDSTNIDALNATARMALHLGRIEEGERLYLQAHALDSTHFHSGLQLAKLHFQLKNFEKAYNYYYALLLQDTTNVSLLTSVGDCLTEMGNPIAVNFYMEAVELNKENASLAIVLINALLGLRQYAPELYVNSALKVCDTALVYNPDNKALLRSKGAIYYLMKEYHACDSIVSGLIAAGDSAIVNFRYVSLAKYNQDLFFDAIPYMERYYEDNTDNTEAAMILGVSLGRTFDRKRALALFDHVEEVIQPKEEMLYQLALQRGIVYQANGNKSESAKNYWQAAQVSKKNQRILLSRLTNLYYLDKRRFEEATPELYARGLFAHVAYLRNVEETPIDKENENNVAHAKSILSLFLEDMFFKDVNRLLMESPDGKKEWVTQEELERMVK